MATSVELSFINSRFHATPWGRHVNEAALEWPPSPWRILRAIASGLLRVGADLQACRETLVSLLAPPSYSLPRASGAHMRQYMPWEKTRGKTERVLVFDAFVVANDPLAITWPDDVPDRELLAKALQAIGYVGRSQSWSELRLLDEPQEPNCRPLEIDQQLPPRTEVTRLLAPDPNHPQAVASLFSTTDEIRSEGLSIPPGTRWVRYARAPVLLDPPPRRRRPRHASAATPTVALYVLESAAPPPLTEALRVTELLRRAAMSWYGRLHQGAVSPTLTGKDASGRPLEGHRHAHYIAADLDRDRRIDHLVVYAPMGLGPPERRALASVHSLEPGRNRPSLNLHLLHFGTPAAFRSPLFAEATRWRSHTPFLPIRHTKVRGSRDNPELIDTPASQVVLELDRRGLPAPAHVRALRGARWLEFRTHRRNDTGPPGAFGFEIEFPAPVRGPLLLGRLSHFGLGLFLPA